MPRKFTFHSPPPRTTSPRTSKMAYERYDMHDAPHMYQDNYNMANGGEVWYPTSALSMDPARALSRRQAHLSSQDYHSGLDSIDEYAPDSGLTRAYFHAPPRGKNFVGLAPPQTAQAFPAVIINGAINPELDSSLLKTINAAVDRLAPAETKELGSNWPYANSKFDPVQDADFSVNSDAYSMPFSELKDAVIGVEATSYLQHMIDDQPAHEPLLAALGGDPIALKHHIENELDRWSENHMRPVFVFDGQSVVGKDEMALKNARAALAKTQKAWELYSNNHPEDAVKTFGASGAVRAQDLYHILQEVLAERGLDFLIAPFSACAQLAYLDTLEEQYIDGIMGSKELLLYEIHDAIINPPTASNWEEKCFYGIIKSELLTKLNVVANPEMFHDALLLVGTSFLPPFPPLQVEGIISSQPYTLTDAINLLRTSNRSVTTTCSTFQDVLEKHDQQWLTKYRKAKMSVKHCCTVTTDGLVHIRDWDNLSGDNSEYLGLQMPSELYHYLSKALIGPRIINCFVHLKWHIFPTLDGVVSDEYKKLVTQSLLPLKETTAALVSSRIARATQFKDIEMIFWFDENLKKTLVHRNMQPQTNQQTDSWGVKDAQLKTQAAATGASPGTLSFALLALQSKDFPAASIYAAPAKGHITGINSKTELQSNVLWRFLHLRGYINDQHQLTSWGKALATTLKAIGPSVKAYKDVHHLEEAAFLAFELLYFDNLNSRNRHSELIGAPLRGSDDDKANCILIGRTSCLLKLRHQNLGYTGPLSKNFLSFHSIIKEVRETDRDLLEGVLASLLLNGQGERPRDDCDGLGRGLPFSKDIDTSLGIAVKTYLDDFLKAEWTPEEREANKAEYIRKYLPHSVNFAEDLDVAFKFFDAVYEGVSTLGKEINEADKKVWDNAHAYLAKRR